MLLQNGVSRMTKQQRDTVTEMRAQNLGYGQIAVNLDVSINTIKSFCRRNGLSGAHQGTDTQPEELSEKPGETGLIDRGSRGYSNVPSKSKRRKGTGFPAGRPVCEVTVSYADKSDETAIDDVLSMFMHSSYGR